MHRGRSYPYAQQFWLVETQFWPDFIPQNFVGICQLGAGTAWDIWNAGLFTSTEPFNPLGAFAGGNCLFFFLTSGVGVRPYIEIKIEKYIVPLHPKRYSVNMTYYYAPFKTYRAQTDLSIAGGSGWMQHWNKEPLDYDPPYNLLGGMFFPMVPKGY